MFCFLLQTFPFTNLFFLLTHILLSFTHTIVYGRLSQYIHYDLPYCMSVTVTDTPIHIQLYIHQYFPISKHSVPSVIYEHCHCHDKQVYTSYNIWSLMICISHHSYYPIVDSTWVCLQVIQSRFILQSSSCIIYIHHVTFWCTGGCCNKSYSTPPIAWWIHILTQYTM